MSVTIAVAKGRLAGVVFDRLEAAGFDCAAAREPGRKLVAEDASGALRFMLVKPADVPTYVDHGVADAGVAGKDTLLEENRPLYELADLGFGQCRLCIAGDPARHAQALRASVYRVATKYPRIAQTLYEQRGQPIEIIRLSGSVELAPLVGLSDVILDIVESGETLRANSLDILEEICPVSARLVVNPVALKTKTEEIRALIRALEI
ncbi:MAG: ATP phosphoribosyltransferase [Oscillospiraceae bacterium]|jgi:ATP phosphoribosyltransferase|nr:ATP phosphoribosyltransferase [Oscillospiraceae bacterium]